MAEIALRLRIQGKVQGVSYRAWTVKQAKSLTIDGWVRNRVDGSVEALVIGEEEQVRELVNRCRKGPLLARVSHVEEEHAQGIAPRGVFEQKPTV